MEVANITKALASGAGVFVDLVEVIKASKNSIHPVDYGQVLAQLRESTDVVVAAVTAILPVEEEPQLELEDAN